MTQESDMEWHPASFFRTDIIPTTPLAILILNQPINENAFDAVRRHGAFYFLCSKQSDCRQACSGVGQPIAIASGEKWIHTPRRFMRTRIHLLTRAG